MLSCPEGCHAIDSHFPGRGSIKEVWQWSLSQDSRGKMSSSDSLHTRKFGGDAPRIAADRPEGSRVTQWDFLPSSVHVTPTVCPSASRRQTILRWADASTAVHATINHIGIWRIIVSLAVSTHMPRLIEIGAAILSRKVSLGFYPRRSTRLRDRIQTTLRR